jgi:RNA polymerase sigma-70 factor (ECF subfamily)
MQQAITPSLQPETVPSFESLFKAQFKGLHAYATTILRDGDAAEDVVQNTFLRLWRQWESGDIPASPAAYLYRAVYNESINLLKHEKVKMAHQQYTLHTAPAGAAAPIPSANVRELESRLDAALQQLPEQCRTIFQMSRFEELKYREIAERLGLSVKTIEAQMGKALRIMRVQLADCLPALLLWFLLDGHPLFLN